MSFDNYANIDENIVTNEAMTILETADGIQQGMDEEDDNGHDKEPMQTPMHFSDVVNALKTIKHFLMHRNVSNKIMMQLSRFEGIVHFVATEKKKQGR